MKKILLTLALVLGLGGLGSLAWANVSHAADFRTGDSPNVSTNEVIDGSLYTAGSNVTVSGTVNGDVFCAGMSINITGTVNGDVLCAGQTIRISGKVEGNVRVAGQQISLDAEIGGSASLGGQTVTVDSTSKIGRDLTIGGQILQINGQVGRDLVGGGQDVTIDGPVTRNVNIGVDNLILNPRAKVGGDLHYSSNNEAVVNGGAVITGQTVRKDLPKHEQVNPVLAGFWLAVFGFGSMLLIGLVGLALAPRTMDALGQAVRTKWLMSLAGGAAMMFLLPFIAIVLMVTIIGIPLAFALLMLWIAALIIASVVTAYALGWLIIEKLKWPPRGRRITSLIIGLLILTLVEWLPYIGGLIAFVSLIFGLGGLAVVVGISVQQSNKGVKHAK